MLNPNIHDIESLFNNQFQGMTRLDAVSIENLIQVQNTLPQAILNLFTEADIKFIIGFKRGEPDWSLLSFLNVEALPAVRWKQKNLKNMDREKHQQAIKKLEQVFK